MSSPLSPTPPRSTRAPQESPQAPAPPLAAVVASVANGIRNPLAAALAQLDRLQSSVAEGSRERETCEGIAESLERIRRLAEDLAEFAAPPSAIARPLSLELWFWEHSPIFRIYAEARDARVIVNIDKDSGEVLADGRALRRAILRLLQNAIEAGAHQIWLDARGADAWTEIRVTDRAPGSGAERALDVRPFQTTKAKNIGLGLALVRAAVASMGGRLRVERTGAGETRASLWLRRAASGEATA